MAVTPGKISGNKIGIYRGGVLIGCATNASFSGTNNQIETTCKDNDGAITFEPGSQEWSMQVSGILVYDNVEGFRQLLAQWVSKATSLYRFGSGNADDPFVEGDGFVSELTWTGDTNAPATWDATISPKGPIYLFNT